MIIYISIKYSVPEKKLYLLEGSTSKKIKGGLEMTKGFYAGSFDPFTIGHLHVVQKASQMFDEVVVGIGVNPDKKRRFDVEEMKFAIRKVISRYNLKNVSVIYYDNLTTDAAKERGATFLIRGLRNDMDYGAEEDMALTNEEISGLDTIYIRAGQFGYISSSKVMELLKYGKDVSKYLPEEVLEIVTK